MRRACFASLVLAAGCASPPPRVPEPHATPAPPLSPAPGTSPERALELGLLTRESALAVQAGAGPLSLLGIEVVSEGDKVGAFVKLERDTCLLLLARGSPSIDDVDLLVFEDDGTAFAADEGSDPRPGLVLCTEVPRRVFAAARVTAGRGYLALGAQRVPRARVEAVARATSARAQPSPSSLDAFATLDVRSHDARRDLGGTWEEVKRIGLPVDAALEGRVTATLDAGRCVNVFAVPSDETADIDVEVEDGRGRILGRATERGRDRSVVVCGSVADELSLSVRPRMGSGIVAVVIARTAADSAPDVVTSLARVDASALVAVADAKKRLDKALEPLGLERAKTIDGAAEIGKRTRISLDVAAGCTRVDVLGGAPVAGLRAELWTPGGARLAGDEGGARVAMHACGPAQKVVVEVEALGRGGPVAIVTHGDKSVVTGLVHPLGGPVLDRLFAGRFVAPRAVKDAKTLDLRVGDRVTTDVVVPAGKCLRAAVAVARGAHGVELSIIAGGDDRDRARGATVTGVRACAEPSRPMSATLEASVAFGRAEARLGWVLE